MGICTMRSFLHDADLSHVLEIRALQRRQHRRSSSRVDPPPPATTHIEQSAAASQSKALAPPPSQPLPSAPSSDATGSAAPPQQPAKSLYEVSQEWSTSVSAMSSPTTDAPVRGVDTNAKAPSKQPTRRKGISQRIVAGSAKNKRVGTTQRITITGRLELKGQPCTALLPQHTRADARGSQAIGRDRRELSLLAYFLEIGQSTATRASGADQSGAPQETAQVSLARAGSLLLRRFVPMKSSTCHCLLY